MTFNNETPHTVNITNETPVAVTWDQANYSWDSAQGTWDNPAEHIVNETPHSLTITNQTKL